MLVCLLPRYAPGTGLLTQQMKWGNERSQQFVPTGWLVVPPWCAAERSVLSTCAEGVYDHMRVAGTTIAAVSVAVSVCLSVCVSVRHPLNAG